METFEQRFSNLPKDSLDRRARSNARLRAEGVPVNDWLPAIESEQDLRLLSTEEVAMRAAATMIVALKGHGMPQDKVDAVVRDYELSNWFSPHEAAFVADPNPSESESQVQTWRYEAANALLWSLGYVDRLDTPRELCDPAAIAPFILEQSRAQFLAGAKLRSKTEILDQADLTYRYRWALVDARMKGHLAPAGLSDDVAMERHQVFNWLMEHADTPWDEISLDT